MDSPSDANKQIVPVSGVVSSNTQEEEEPSVDQSSSSAVVVAPPPSPATPPAQNYQVVIPDHNREYGCPFCKKKFSSKQALGGHQNAHKVERLMVKNLQEQRNNNLDYLRSSSHARYGAGGPSFTSYRHRYSPYSFGCTGHHHSGGCPGVIPYSSRPLLPPSSSFSGWPAPNPAPTVGPFPGSIQYTIPIQNIHIRLPNFEAGTSSNAGAGAGAGAGQGSPAGGAINLRNVPEPEEDDDSDIDLSLKLSYN